MLADTTTVYFASSIALLFALSNYLDYRKRKQKLNYPSVVPSGWLTSIIGVIQCMFNVTKVVEEGYRKYPGRMVTLPIFGAWRVVVGSKKHVEEVAAAPEDVFSFGQAVNDGLAIEYTLGPSLKDNHYHVAVVRSALTRNIAALFEGIIEETTEAFEGFIPVPENGDWVQVPAWDTLLQIVSRISSRVFIGLPLCRDPEYNKMSINFATRIVAAAGIINSVPNFMRDFVGRMMSTVPKTVREARKFLAPIIEERLRLSEEYGNDYPDKPNDMLSWLMDEAEGNERSVDLLIIRLLTINFAAIHTSTMTFTHVLYHLAAEPEKYLVPMREEAERIIEKEGWTKASTGKMRKIDSFMRETGRFSSIFLTNLGRVVMKDYTFADGTFVPKGANLTAPLNSLHFDEENYKDAHKFEGFRFADIREEEGEGLKHQMVSTNSSFVLFGHGRHACPGRFFAVNEMKVMLIYVILNYDVKFEKEGVRPVDKHFQGNRLPDMKAKVMFRKRQRT